MPESLQIPLRRTPWVVGAAQPVALEVLRRGPISRADIGARLNLSHASLSRLSNPLIEQGILHEVGERTTPGAGRPTRLLDIDPHAHHFLGLKVQAHEISAAVTNLRGDPLAATVTPLTDTSPAAVVAQIHALARQLGARHALSGLGIGLGGAVSGRRVVRRAPHLAWADVHLADLVEARSGIPTLVENDVLTLCEYEGWFGDARHDDRFAVVTLGIGTGFGLSVGGHPLSNDDYGIGLVGHWPLLANSPLPDSPLADMPLCEKGHAGCAEAILSSPSIAARVSDALGTLTSFDAALDLAAARQPAAENIVREAARGLGVLLAAICNLTLPQRIIIAGEGARLAQIGWDDLLRSLHSQRDELARTPPIEVSADANREWARGAAALAIQAFARGV